MDQQLPDFNNLKIAFESKSDKELNKAVWLFKMMNSPTLVKFGSKLGLWAVENNIPFTKSIVENTIFEQFCGGTSFESSINSINKLKKYNIKTVLDYGAEGKETEADWDKTKQEFLNAIDFSSNQSSVPLISIKVTGLSRFELLEKVSANRILSEKENFEWQKVKSRVDAVCQKAFDKKLGVFIDAEETWIQDAIDHLVDEMMEKYNRERVTVFNTFQCYRKDRYDYLVASHHLAKQKNYLLGAKLVRGAYMEKERERAATLELPSPINIDKATTDAMYNKCLKYCFDHLSDISVVNATHNANSSMLLARWIVENNIAKDHPHTLFCQLYGMSDNLTFNLAKSGFNASKYLVYGSIKDVIPYLIRRAQENSAVSGDMSREYKMYVDALKERKQN